MLLQYLHFIQNVYFSWTLLLWRRARSHMVPELGNKVEEEDMWQCLSEPFRWMALGLASPHKDMWPIELLQKVPGTMGWVCLRQRMFWGKINDNVSLTAMRICHSVWLHLTYAVIYWVTIQCWISGVEDYLIHGTTLHSCNNHYCTGCETVSWLRLSLLGHNTVWSQIKGGRFTLAHSL